MHVYKNDTQVYYSPEIWVTWIEQKFLGLPREIKQPFKVDRGRPNLYNSFVNYPYLLAADCSWIKNYLGLGMVGIYQFPHPVFPVDAGSYIGRLPRFFGARRRRTSFSQKNQNFVKNRRTLKAGVDLSIVESWGSCIWPKFFRSLLGERLLLGIFIRVIFTFYSIN